MQGSARVSCTPDSVTDCRKDGIIYLIPYFAHCAQYYTTYYISYHPRSGVCNTVGSVCLYVCLSDDNLRKPWRRKFTFVDAVYLHGLRVKFLYEGYRVKVKVTGAKKVENSYSSSVKLPSAITPVPSNTELWCLRAAWGFRYGGSNGVTTIFVTWSELTTWN